MNRYTGRICMAFLQCVCVIVFLQVTCFNGRIVAFITRDRLLSGMCLHVYIEVLLLWTWRCTAYTSERLLSRIGVYVPFEGARCCANKRLFTTVIPHVIFEMKRLLTCVAALATITELLFTIMQWLFGVSTWMLLGLSPNRFPFFTSLILTSGIRPNGDILCWHIANQRLRWQRCRW